MIKTFHLVTGLFLTAIISTHAQRSGLSLPPVGTTDLQILSPTKLELSLITTRPSQASAQRQWDFADAKGKLLLPDVNEFVVLAGTNAVPVKTLGFRRRVLYAPLKQRDLRIGNYLYIELQSPIPDNASVRVQNPNGKYWPKENTFHARMDSNRLSPAIHVNQVGYQTDGPKKAMVGYFLGSMGELQLGETNAPPAFEIVEATTRKKVFSGQLALRRDKGFPFAWYQQVWEADFGSVTNRGEYRLAVPGLGASFPFWIEEGSVAAFARTYALGLYHQRCGTANELPFTRHVHGPCHTAPAEIPDARFKDSEGLLAESSADFAENKRHTAPQLKDFDSSLYPFVNKGKVDVRGGHHDAGDYSKYTINSAAFIHQLIFAVDAFAGVGELDNLGIPESGDAKSDLLQEAKWEADFLARMQDADGGFYFLVYPRERRYENDVTPDKGDSQIVWPKTTSVTAASVAALAQCAGSPLFKKQFPSSAEDYLNKAKRGWQFLEQAIAKYGKDGAYQKITHYGDPFMHDDELAWAACELFLATGDEKYHAKLSEWLQPENPDTRKWGWWRLYEAYGCAIRSYAFAARSGKLPLDRLNKPLLTACENELLATGDEQAERSQASAYGTSFPIETKRTATAGWYFSGDAAFDLAVAWQLESQPTPGAARSASSADVNKTDGAVERVPANDTERAEKSRAKFRDAIFSNLNYEAGCNPVNVSFLTGLGGHRPREIVHQYAQNDRRVLPPSGIPIGNLQGGFGWMDVYGKELGELSFPLDGDERDPYPIYDRWGDSFNLSTEFVILNQARALAYLAFLMAQTPLKNQPWKSATAHVVSVADAKSSTPSFTLKSSLDLTNAQVVWESSEGAPLFGTQFIPTNRGALQWLEAEALLPDGRRIFAVTNFPAKSLLRGLFQ